PSLLRAWTSPRGWLSRLRTTTPVSRSRIWLEPPSSVTAPSVPPSGRRVNQARPRRDSCRGGPRRRRSPAATSHVTGQRKRPSEPLVSSSQDGLFDGTEPPPPPR